MRHKIHKVFLLWEFDKEEKWLNEMAAKGLALVGVGYCTYTFEDCAPGEYNIRLELLENLPNHTESQQYIKFLEETGAEYIGSLIRWVYFRKRTDTGTFDLYSDNHSRINHLNRMLALMGVFIIALFLIGSSPFLLHWQTGFQPYHAINLLNLALGGIFLYGFIRIFFKKRKLQKELNLFE